MKICELHITDKNNKYLLMKLKILVFFLLAFAYTMNAQKVIPLYDNIPNNIDTINQERTIARGKFLSQVTKPTLTIYLPSKEKATGMSVIVCPGGGYAMLSMIKEGYDIAHKLNEMGIAAFVLKYRLPDDKKMNHKELCPLQDAQRAIQLVRQHTNEYNIDAGMVGIMGFSAGGHLAATASTHFQKSYISNNEKTNLRPDFSVLIYPVISFSDNIGHLGSRASLIGGSPSSELINEFSNELKVNSDTPPAFLLLGQKDLVVNPLNSLVYYEALLRNKIPDCELHVYPTANHGFGIKLPESEVNWMDQLKIWLSLVKNDLKKINHN